MDLKLIKATQPYELQEVEPEPAPEIVVTKDMINNSNRFLAVEGIDCTGKGSITQLIEKKGLGIEGITVKRVDFPQYDLPSGEIIKSYLNGNFGDYARHLSSIPEGTAVEWYSMARGRMERLIKDIRFVMQLYAINRIEYFKTTELEPDTVYVFDRFSYSNIIHHLSALYAFIDYGAGNDLFQIDWRRTSHKEVSFDFFKHREMLMLLDKLRGEIYGYENYNDVPLPYTFLLLLDEHHIMERLRKRKETKHEGDDILERFDSIHRACEFLSPKMLEFHMDHGVVPIPIAPFSFKNEDIANTIIELYKTAVCNEIDPMALAEYLDEDDNDEDEDYEE